MMQAREVPGISRYVLDAGRRLEVSAIDGNADTDNGACSAYVGDINRILMGESGARGTVDVF